MEVILHGRVVLINQPSQKIGYSLISDSDEDENKLLSQGCHYIDPYNENIKHVHFKTKDCNLDILQLNIQSLSAKKYELMELTSTLKQQHIIIHIILLCETFINTTNIDYSAIPGNRMHYSIRDDRKGVGVAFTY